MISSQFLSMFLLVCAIQFPPTQIDHKVLNWKGDSSLNKIGILI